ncbi:hypothetical protein GGS23DRAFT_579652 [Durotheca rogersii]|uniref:uncharacterized protein n=1 Tax=Durotheca rogersii TaxID=419775 RepID=UPI00221EBD82|nr:uncharacterized protein GGS23DRAFT_579652 [Durotheca rogersii]KAI5860647.1 hypothetical protein GGS23DRAFT_579652 [Durotheca rogersii]
MADNTQRPLSIPSFSEDLDWDTRLIIYDPKWIQVTPERRHSGWETVERKWAGNNQPSMQATSFKEPRRDVGNACEAMRVFSYPHVSIPTPKLEFNFRMKVVCSSQSASVAVGDGFKKWSTFSDGVWSGSFGHGIIASGGQDSQDLTYGNVAATYVEATHRLQTRDEPPAHIECKARGYMTGPPEVMKALRDPETSEQVDPRLCQYRVFVTMKTTDERYAAKLNTGMWIGSCLWRGLEVIYDSYRIS